MLLGFLPIMLLKLLSNKEVKDNNILCVGGGEISKLQ